MEKLMDTVTRSCFLTFSEDTKTVKVSAKGGTESGKVTIQVTVKIPKSLFKNPVIIHAHIDLPDFGGPSQEMLVDLKQALGMAYGNKIQLIVEPSSATESTKDS
ncbi:unnamed protein product [Sphagnum balticum]